MMDNSRVKIKTKPTIETSECQMGAWHSFFTYATSRVQAPRPYILCFFLISTGALNSIHYKPSVAN